MALRLEDIQIRDFGSSKASLQHIFNLNASRGSNLDAASQCWVFKYKKKQKVLQTNAQSKVLEANPNSEIFSKSLSWV
jgi:hypothetical protein